MNETKELISLFSTPLTRTNIGRRFTKEEVECIANIPMTRAAQEREAIFPESQRWMYRREKDKLGSQSESYDILDKFEELKDLKTYCEEELKAYLEDIEGVNTDITNLRITKSWLNKIEPQDFHALHNHKNSHLSGVFYISCLPNDNIQFINKSVRFPDTTLELPKKKMTEFNSQGISVNIKEGDLLLFPSWVPHQVSVNKTVDKERLSISFDTWPTHIPSLYYPYK